MGLVEALERATQPRERPSVVDEWLTGDRLTDDEKQALRKALEDPRIGARTIERLMRESGYTMSDSSITRWRDRNGVRTESDGAR